MRFLFILLFLPLFVFSENVVISGKAPSYSNYDIEVVVYDDYITNTEKTLALSTISGTGDFKLNFPLTYTTNVILKVDQKQAILYIEPGKSYDLSILSSDSLQTGVNIKKLSYQLNSKDTMELNALIRVFNYKVNEFVF